MSPTRQAALLDSLTRVTSGLDWDAGGHGVGRLRRDAPRTTTQSAAAKDALVDERDPDAGAVGRLGPRRERRPLLGDRRPSRRAGRRASTSTRPPASATGAPIVSGGETRILPLLQDLADPSPAIGWDAPERAVPVRPRRGRDAARARAGPPPGHRPQRAAADAERDARPPRRRADHRVGAQGRPDGRAAPREPRGRVPRLHGGRVPGGLRARVDDRRSPAVAGTARVLYLMRRAPATT